MEGVSNLSKMSLLHRSLILMGLVGAILLADSGPALAWKWHTTDARSRSTDVTYSIREERGTNGSFQVTSGQVTCSYELSLGNIGTYSGYWKDSPSKTSVLARRTCSDGTDEFVWVDGCAFLDLGRMCPEVASVDPVVLAREARDRLTVPGIRISSNPRRGLVGIRSWFWIEGGGRPLSESLSRFGIRVDVEARPVSYEWDFGDGAIKTSNSPGRPYPRRSEVTHTYERSSAHFTDGYPVSVAVVFDVRWRTNGGRWRALPGITRVSERFYRVAESQAVNSDG